MHFSYLVALGIVTLVAAQDTIDPSTVTAQNKQTWCNSQLSTCPLLCTQINNGSAAYYLNDCDPTSLSYHCLCGNNKTPNATEYTQTLPYFICTENNNRCVTNCGAGNNQCASDCRTNHPCGAKNPQRYNVTSTSSAATQSATASGQQGSSSSSSSSNSDGTVSVNGNSGSGASTGGSGVSASSSLVANMGLVTVAGSIFASAMFML